MLEIKFKTLKLVNKGHENYKSSSCSSIGYLRHNALNDDYPILSLNYTKSSKQYVQLI